MFSRSLKAYANILQKFDTFESFFNISLLIPEEPGDLPLGNEFIAFLITDGSYATCTVSVASYYEIVKFGGSGKRLELKYSIYSKEKFV